MYYYDDYFDESNKDTPYHAVTEELDDWLRFIDMVLEGYLEFKRSEAEDNIFSRGLVITESEMEHYFTIPPKFRERDSCDPVLAASAKQAIRKKYIGKSVAKLFKYGEASPIKVFLRNK